MWAVVGLGNPGAEYSKTRHNVGFMLLKQVARGWNIRMKRRKYHSRIGERKSRDRNVLLVMPQTFMNNSGVAVKQVIEGRGLRPEHIVVVYDDLDIPLGEIRIREEGGPGTHKGMGSIIGETQSTKFPRIRIGIGPLPPDEDAVRFVLSPFDPTERLSLKESLSKAHEALTMIVDGRIDRAMNTYNQKKRTQGLSMK